MRILLADDQALSGLALKAQIEALGHDVVGPARDGNDAVAIAAAGRIDAAILDVRMPGLGGIEAAERIFEASPIPILILSGYSHGHAPRVRMPPVTRYLVKPVGLEDLRVALREACAEFEAWQAG